MYKLYGNSGMANLAPHMALETIGVPYEMILVDTQAKQHQMPAYLRLNPTGRVPTLVDGDQPVFETAAILLHLADRHPAAGLMPPLGSLERALAYQWLIHLTNSVQVAYLAYYYPERQVADPAFADSVKQAAESRLNELFDVIETALEGREWLTGDRPGIVDFMLMMLVRWGRNFAARPPRTLPNLGAHAARTASLPAVIRAFEQEGLARPWY
ncbi:glutathione S-transferase family protein [Niveispirillum sp.]|uniref:glutathione S-transferase family protein n=1 Tax=Niveispirillum sp. TaxID=1917217 RepID=UPI001B62DA53|nr:glutathione S-transferase family protein [Niveispirillum sp.]MBP7335314.1 glutathione S-transferase family protein [Niveispirillum sp.]